LNHDWSSENFQKFDPNYYQRRAHDDKYGQHQRPPSSHDKLSSYKVSQTIIVSDHVGSQPTIKETDEERANRDPLELQDLLGHEKLHKSNKTYGPSTQVTPVLEEVVNLERKQSGAKRTIKVSAPDRILILKVKNHNLSTLNFWVQERRISKL